MTTTVETPVQDPPSPPADPPTDKGVVPLFAGLMVVMLLGSLDQTVLSTALPTIVGELHGVDKMSWVVTGYILASTVTMPIYGRVSDRFGRKPVLLTAIALFMGGSLLGGCAGSIEWLIAGRALQGLGGGGLMILSQAAIADAVPARRRGKFMGVMGAVFAVSSVAGPLLGGWLTEGPGWRWTLWLNVPLGVLALTAIAAFLPAARAASSRSARIDYLGMTLVAAATSALVLVCTWGGTTYDWTSWQILALVAATVVLTVAFLAAEARADEPVIPLSLFHDRTFVVATIGSLVMGIAMFGAVGYLPTYIQMVTGVDATEAGLLMIPMMAGVLVASTVSGQLVSRTGRYRAYPVVGAVVMGIGLFLLSTLDIDSPTWLLCTYAAVFGTGLGLGQQILVLVVQNAFPDAIVGTATAAVSFFRQVGATVGSAVVGSVFASRLTDQLHQHLAALGTHTALAGGGSSLTPEKVSALPAPLRTAVLQSYSDALLPVFAWLVPLAAVAAIVLVFIENKPLQTSLTEQGMATAEPATSQPPVGTPSAGTSHNAQAPRAAAWISGHVVRPGDPTTRVAGAAVTLLDKNGRPVATQLSGEQGAYVFEHLAPGDYTIAVHTPVTSTSRAHVGPTGATVCDVTLAAQAPA